MVSVGLRWSFQICGDICACIRCHLVNSCDLDAQNVAFMKQVSIAPGAVDSELADVIVGLGGDDIIRGAFGSDTICGGDGDDHYSRRVTGRCSVR